MEVAGPLGTPLGLAHRKLTPKGGTPPPPPKAGAGRAGGKGPHRGRWASRSLCSPPRPPLGKTFSKMTETNFSAPSRARVIKRVTARVSIGVYEGV